MLSKKPTPLVCEDASSDQMKSPFGVSPFPVHRTSEIPIISYLNRFISFLSSSSLPAAHNVCTFHVPTVRVFLASFSFCAFLVVYEFFPVANFSTLPWSLDRGRGPCFTGRRPSRHELSLIS